MAVIVNHSPQRPEEVWQVARWAFASLLRQAIAECEQDFEVRSIFERAIALDGLHLHLLTPDEAFKVRTILTSVASRAARGQLPDVEVAGRVLDVPSQIQFRTAAAELEALLSV